MHIGCVSIHACRCEVAEAVKELCCAGAAGKSGASSMDWISGIPLYSFLTGTFVPYEDVCSKCDDFLVSNWNFLRDKFELKNVRTKIENDNLL